MSILVFIDQKFTIILVKRERWLLNISYNIRITNKTMAQFQVRGLTYSQILNPAIPYISVRALKFKHIQRDTIALIAMYTQYLLLLLKV